MEALGEGYKCSLRTVGRDPQVDTAGQVEAPPGIALPRRRLPASPGPSLHPVPWTGLWRIWSPVAGRWRGLPLLTPVTCIEVKRGWKAPPGVNLVESLGKPPEKFGSPGGPRPHPEVQG